MKDIPMQITVNGIEREYNGDPNISLLKFLRNVVGVTSPKNGCGPQGTCGCCTVELNGRSILSCSTPVHKADGGVVYTIEGLDEYFQRTIAHAFVEKGGVQCGFCIPGIVMTAKVLLERNPAPTRKQITQALTPHLCRCTGYKKIIDSIEYAAEAIRERREIPKPKNDGKVGGRQPKYDSEKLVLGQSYYVADIVLPNMLFGVLKFSDHPRAIVKSINPERALAHPGVERVVTARDIPGQRYQGLIVKDWPQMVDIGEETRYIGDVLAVVVAKTEDIAREAVQMIEVEYEVLPPVSDPEKALLPGTPNIHPKGNLLSNCDIKRGDLDKAIANTAFVSKGTYHTQRIEHAFMETECAVAQATEHGIEVLSQGQGVYEDQKQIASYLNLPLEQVRVILVPNGGGFGGKEDLTVQAHAALCAHLLRVPVKIRLNRDESIIMHPKRHPMRMHYEVGCDVDGHFTYLKADILGDTGAYASVGMKVLERAAGHATGPYHIPCVDLTSKAVYTNNLPCGAMRGFGVNQTAFAIESCIDDLCAQGGFDRWQFRYDNALTEGSMTSTGQKLNRGVGIRSTLLALKDEFQNAKYAGIACGIKNTGIGNGMNDEGKIVIEIIASDKVILNHGWTEMGQGVNTMAVQFVHHETGIDPSIISVVVDTKAKAVSGMTTASRATSIIGNSIANTCIKLREDLSNHTLDQLVGKKYEGQWVCDWTTKPGKETDEIITHYSYSYATQVVVLNDEGEIDTIYAAHDAGRIINPTLFEGQIEGSVHMGLGYAISEDLPLEECRPVSTKLRDCGILRAKQTPKIIVKGIEVPDPHGPHGSKGVGEIGLVPTAGAVANAFCQYDGTRYYRLPIKERVKAQ